MTTGTRSASAQLLPCPFCGESDFDLIGLKGHLLRGWCPAFESIPLSKPPMRATASPYDASGAPLKEYPGD